jgi:hypothetical protein
MTREPGLAAISSKTASRSGGIEFLAQRIANAIARGRAIPIAKAPRTICLANRVGISGAWASMMSPR